MKKRFNIYELSNKNKKLLEKDPKMPLVDKIIYDTLEKRVLIQVPEVNKGFIDVYSPRYGMYSIRGRGNTLEQAVDDYYLNEKELLKKNRTMKTEKLNYELLPGDLIDDIIKKAIEQAIKTNSLVWFNFNGTKIIVDKTSKPEYVKRDYFNAAIIGLDVIKPPYKKTIDEETNKKIKDHLEKIEQQKKEQEIKEKELREKENKAILERIKNIKLEVKNEKEWEKFKKRNQDPLGKAVIDFAERWGKLMQVDMKSGLSVEESATTTSLEADFEGITGAMAQLGKNVLIKFWKYGDKLEKVKHI